MTNDDTRDQRRTTASEAVPVRGSCTTVETDTGQDSRRTQGDNLMALVLALADASIRISGRR